LVILNIFHVIIDEPVKHMKLDVLDGCKYMNTKILHHTLSSIIKHHHEKM